MGEEDAATEENVWFVARELFKALQQSLVYSPSAKLVNELVVVDGLLLAICGNASLYLPRSDHLGVVGRWLGWCPEDGFDRDN